MTFPRLRAPGLWVTGSVLSAAELETLDDHQSKAIDGYAGGTWAPTSEIVLGGAGLHVTGLLKARQTTIEDGYNVTFGIGTTFNDNGTANFFGPTNIKVGATATIDGTLAVPGSATFSGGVGFTNAAVVTDRAEWNRYGTENWQAGGVVNYLAFAGAEFKSNSLLYIDSGVDYQQRADNQRTGADLPSGNGAYRGLRTVTLTDASAPIYPEHHDIVFVPTGLTATRTYTIQDPVDPTMSLGFWIRQKGPAGQANDAVISTSAGTLCTLQAGSGYYTSVFVVWDPDALRWDLLTWTPSQSPWLNTISLP